ncbi:hypothetical protein GIY11_05375 [Aerococcaceae bacterium DSM 109653]|uniref:Uncharacterized protein n=2 Tax=Fundicoccus ignavus TaxID=2664442 RepID=A0A844BU32_9LACT|nr:hypothetical protein [Fundicoccus ignavus]MRI81443.1 hypothetical protein [Fundicoccus ignavus]
MILQVLMYAFPSMMIIISAYLYIYRNSLIELLNLNNPRLIKLFSLTFLLMGLLGFVLNLIGVMTFIYIWMIVSLLLTGILSFMMYSLLK